MNRIPYLIVWICAALPAAGQIHLAPVHRGEGLAGPEPHSFVMIWEQVPGALRYQYVLTDNAQCFLNCAGDTRQGFTEDTLLIAPELLEETWYYWITRVWFADGDSSEWTLPSAFFTYTPPVDSLISLRGAGSGGPLALRIDWAAHKDLAEIRLHWTDLQGRSYPGPVLRRDQPISRFQLLEQLRPPGGGRLWVLTAVPVLRDGFALRPYRYKLLDAQP